MLASRTPRFRPLGFGVAFGFAIFSFGSLVFGSFESLGSFGCLASFTCLVSFDCLGSLGCLSCLGPLGSLGVDSVFFSMGFFTGFLVEGSLEFFKTGLSFSYAGDSISLNGIAPAFGLGVAEPRMVGVQRVPLPVANRRSICGCGIGVCGRIGGGPNCPGKDGRGPWLGL